MSTIPTAEDRFAFGENWLRFLQTIDEPRIEAAIEGLRQILVSTDLMAKPFGHRLWLGTFQLSAARDWSDVDGVVVRLRRVLSGLQPRVEATLCGRRSELEIGQGSAIDADYMQSLGKFDNCLFGACCLTPAIKPKLWRWRRSAWLMAVCCLSRCITIKVLQAPRSLVKRIYQACTEFEAAVGAADCRWYETKSALARLLRGKNPLPFQRLESQETRPW